MMHKDEPTLVHPRTMLQQAHLHRSILCPMPTVSFDIPPEALSALRRAPDEFARDMRLAAAMHWYRRGDLSQEKAAMIAGLDRADFLAALAREQIDVFQVDVEDLRQELNRSPSS